MRWIATVVLASAWTAAACGQAPLTGPEVVDRSIAFHDPQGMWAQFDRTLVMRETRPRGEERQVLVTLDRPHSRFVYERNDGGTVVVKHVAGDECTPTIDGSPDIPTALETRYDLTCPRILRSRNYYLFLWGLPMKLRDPGTRVEPDVVDTSFQDRPVVQVRVTYDEAVGQDTWYFYFDPTSYQLVGYRFYHDEAVNDGEYIVLDRLYAIDGMQLPRRRSWYTNDGDRHLGTDELWSHRTGH